MPTKPFDDPTQTKQARIRRYTRELEALSVLRQKKAEVVTDVAHWMNNQKARLEVTALQVKVADLDDARRRVIVVAATGIASLIGGAAITHLFARRAGAAFTFGRLARPVATLASPSVVSSAPFRITLAQFAKGQVAKGVMISVPVAIALRKFVGSSAVDEVTSAARRFGHGPIPRGHASLRARAALPPSEADEAAELIVRHLMNAPELVQALCLIDRTQRQAWYRSLRAEVTALIERDYGDLASHERTALFCALMWDFLNQARNAFDRMDRQWSEDTKAFVRAIEKERRSISRIATRRAG